MNREYRKNLIRSIKKSLGRYLAILAIIALGVGFFAGLKSTRPAMVKAAQDYIDLYQLYDFRVLSTIGFTKEEIDKASKINQVASAEGALVEDFIYLDEQGSTGILKAHSITEKVNTLEVEEGRMPQKANECVLDASYFSKEKLGTKIQIATDNAEETKNSFVYSEYIVVGLVQSPTYLNIERGTTSLGDGKVTGFIYIPLEGFTFEYYEELYISYDNEDKIYSNEYKEFIESVEGTLENEITTLVENRYYDIVSEGKTEIQNAKAKLDSELASASDELSDALSKLNNALVDIQSGEREITQGLEQINQKELELNNTEAALTMQMQQAVNLGDATLIAQIQVGLNQITAARLQIDTNREYLINQQNQIKQARSDWESGMADYEKGIKELETKKSEALIEIQESEDELNQLEKPECYLLSREMNSGYSNFENDSSIVEAVAKLFPIFFFLIASLVCSTTMTRMIDDERTQIGTFRALGYNNITIILKYLLYSGSAAIIGCIGGFVAGIHLFPYTIWNAYGILYGFTDIKYVIDYGLLTISILVSLLCTVGTTYVAGRNVLRNVPADLIRPKMPTAGKRIFLERLPFLWRRMKFLHKVSARNIFRFKKRMIMMIVGIAGCTALVLTGYGVRDSVSNIANFQFNEIMKHDLGVIFSDGVTESAINNVEINYFKDIKEYTTLFQSSAEVLGTDKRKSVYLLATDEENISNFVDLHRNGKQVAFPGKGEIAICERLAEFAQVNIGDQITLELDQQKVSLTVSGIFENYINNYAYLSAETYHQYFQKEYQPNTLYLSLNEGVDEYSIAAYLSDMEDVSTVTLTNEIRNQVQNTMSRLDYVIILIIGCAGALALVVLINLSNINISERVREIATLKVLGFYPRETGSYVFRESMVLSIMGMIVGLPLGVLLHRFVIDQIQIELVTFQVTILPLSYLYSIITVLGFTVISDLLMRHKINKVAMAESLKSID